MISNNCNYFKHFLQPYVISFSRDEPTFLSFKRFDADYESFRYSDNETHKLDKARVSRIDFSEDRSTSQVLGPTSVKYTVAPNILLIWCTLWTSKLANIKMMIGLVTPMNFQNISHNTRNIFMKRFYRCSSSFLSYRKYSAIW